MPGSPCVPRTADRDLPARLPSVLPWPEDSRGLTLPRPTTPARSREPCQGEDRKAWALQRGRKTLSPVDAHSLWQVSQRGRGR